MVQILFPFMKKEMCLMFFFSPSAMMFESGACITEGDARSERRAVMRFLTVGIAIMKLRYKFMFLPMFHRFRIQLSYVNRRLTY